MAQENHFNSSIPLDFFFFNKHMDTYILVVYTCIQGKKIKFPFGVARKYHLNFMSQGLKA